MIVTVAVGAACALALISLRSCAYAFTQAVGHRPVRASGTVTPARRSRRREQELSRRLAFVMLVEIAFSFGIALLSIGLAAAAALPGHLLIGALLAQVAVLGALFAPPVFYQARGVTVRPAAFALGIAQLAHVAFVLRAIEALV